jgi:hypothetical protein
MTGPVIRRSSFVIPMEIGLPEGSPLEKASALLHRTGILNRSSGGLGQPGVGII